MSYFQCSVFNDDIGNSNRFFHRGFLVGKIKLYIDINDVIFKTNPLAVKSSKVKDMNIFIVER